MSNSVVIGIAGGSGSGKSTVLDRLLEGLGADSVDVSVLDHDAYYVDLSHRTPGDRAGFNFDHPDALETELLVEQLDQLTGGQPIEKPIYDFTTHTRTDETKTIDPAPVIIVEGILVLAEPALVERMDIRIFIDADDDIRLVRRIRRDMDERGRSLDSILSQYEKTVRPMHIEFVEPSKRRADVIIPNGGFNTVAVEMVLARIRMLLQRKMYAET